jgi:hypothetical protein
MTKVRITREPNVEELYFDWLYEKVDRKDSNREKCKDLVYELHNKEFYSILPNDDNRCIDGMKLRECFAEADEIYQDIESLDGPCSVFEMLVALSQRMDFQLSESGNGDLTAKWFWVLIKNLGLKLYSPNDPRSGMKKRLNDLIIKKLVERTYSPTGEGGMFPLRNPRTDQRKVEIWYQMMAWCAENY